MLDKTDSLCVENLTRGITVVIAGRLASSFWARLRGLMGAGGLTAGEGLVIKPCSSVHTHFMRFAIDVLYVGRDDTVVGIDRNLKPWRIGGFYKQAHYVVELPAGGAALCQVGDRLQLRVGPSRMVAPADSAPLS